MKRYFYLLASLVFLGSCTLSMEDWITPEEDLGKEEPYTIENEYGTVTYQFRDSVLYVTDHVQEDYLIRVERDSILYFNASIPKKWRPYVGMKMAAGCSHQLYYGLNHRVLSVEDVGGILKVVTTKVSTDEVYKHLSYCIDADIVAPDLGGMSEEELKDYGYELVVNPETGDSIIMDWNNYDVAKGLRPAQAKRRSLKSFTRADDDEEEEIEEKVGDKSGIEKTQLLDVFVDTRDVSGIRLGKGLSANYMKGLINDFLKSTEEAHEDAARKLIDHSLYAGFGLKIEHFQRVHAEEDKDRNYELKYTDSWTEITAKAEAGFQVNKNNAHGSNLADEAHLGIPTTKFINGLKEAKKTKSIPKDLINEKRSWRTNKIRIIFPFTPSIAFIAFANVNPTVELSGSVCGSISYTTDKVRTGYENINGEKKEFEDEIIEKGSFSSPKVIANGSLKLGGNFRAAAGLEFASTVSVTLGANVNGAVELSGEVNILDMASTMTEDDEDASLLDALSGNIRFYVDFYGDIQLHVAPLGISLWDKEINKFLVKHIINFSYSLSPDIYYNSGYAKFGTETGLVDMPDDMGLIRGYYQFRNLDGANAWISPSLTYPGMIIYFGPIENKNFTYMEPCDEEGTLIESMSQWKSVEEGKTYDFRWIGVLKDMAKNDETIDEVHLVPVLYKYVSSYNPLYGGDVSFEKAKKYIVPKIELKDNQFYVEVARPLITTSHAGQLSGGASYVFQDEVDGYISTENGASGGQSIDTSKFRQYSFYTTLDVQSATRMKEWGVLVYIYGPDKKKKLMRRHQVPVNQNRSGKYTLIFNFLTDWEQPEVNSGEEQNLYFRIIPYWTEPKASGAVIEATDEKSMAKYPIKYEMEYDYTNVVIDESGKTTWGTVMPTIDLLP